MLGGTPWNAVKGVAFTLRKRRLNQGSSCLVAPRVDGGAIGAVCGTAEPCHKYVPCHK